MQSLNMKEGEVVLYDHALWHSSPINQSNELRIALVLGMVPLNAELRYYEMDGSVVSEYESYPEFFMENNRDSGGSKLNKLRDFELKNQQLSLNDFHRIYLGSENQLNSSSFFKSLYNRLFK